MRCLIYLCSLLFLTGCTNLVTQKRALVVADIKNPNVKTMSIPIDIRLSRSFTASDGKIYICDQPMPDVARSDSFGSKGNLSAKLADSGGVLKQDIGGEGNINSSTAVLQLNGRSSAVLLARDLMYQICLSAANGTFAAQQELFKDILKIVDKVADKEKATAQSNQLATQALILRPEIVENNRNALLGVSLVGIAKTYHKCSVDAEKNKDQSNSCDNELNKDIKQKIEGK
ncbi:hypothetical protein I5554_16340 [Acinetobacter sp. TGL-Y2]|nr:hypothetical protein [Acinetobacter sp. TGL-Y2]